MRISFRRAEPVDYDYCARLYFAEMERTILELNLDMAAHAARIRQLLVADEVRIVRLNRPDQMNTFDRRCATAGASSARCSTSTSLSWPP
mgnify:CR=1 FL=1